MPPLRARRLPPPFPAVICLVERAGRALLAHGPQFAAGMFSCLAGFVEPGESLEEAVAREVLEEVGIEVREIRYFGSQPWPFPNSLMIGFTAEWRSGEDRGRRDRDHRSVVVLRRGSSGVADPDQHRPQAHRRLARPRGL